MHHGLALSLFLFAMVIEGLTDKIRQESPGWNKMFEDDSENREVSGEKATG